MEDPVKTLQDDPRNTVTLALDKEQLREMFRGRSARFGRCSIIMSQGVLPGGAIVAILDILEGVTT